ncbi:PKD domain-containing protein [Acanthopleuribacter pedis]|uniref:PKD domain-containing protein n=1 Tax=Acanthopleuribacter pedis TaxID=442870 RepID=A0A8J7QCJ2_9BACT|nr:PKD domain-containing protein [Acanthopleuribacter pedis]MBO1321624.1 PKD domain-containing protein [Acanthopleuribacter pedis]
MKLTTFLLCFTALWSVCLGASFDPGPGKTRLIVGQTFQNEYADYVEGTGLVPQGSSHYATFYLGRIEQGDDDPNSAFLDWVRTNQLGEHALVALSFKDNTFAGGYGQMTNNTGDQFNPDAIWEAMQDINAGRWDNQIDAFADLMKARPDTKFYLRVGYEVSLLLFAYQGNEYVVDWLNRMANSGVNVFENPDTIADLDRQAYINAYNYVANRLRNVNGVSNLDFVYHPVRGFNDTRWLYPGDQFVDWVAFSVFNNDVCIEVNGTFNCQGQSVDPNLDQSVQFARQRGKPIMVAEAAVQAPAAQSESGFIDYLNRLDQFVKTYDVRFLAYINSNWPVHGWGPEWGDSRVEARNGVLQHWLQTFGNGTRYLHGDSTEPPPPPPQNGELRNGVPVSGLAAKGGEWLEFFIDVPQNAENLTVTMSGGNGDADLYTRFNQSPNQSEYACRPYSAGNNETCREANPTAGRWMVGIHAYRAFSGLTVTATYTTAQGENQPPVAEAGGPYNGQVNQNISFSANGSTDADGTITAYRWDFGDGQTGSGANTNHRYAAAGTYRVTLTVTDNEGATDQDRAEVRISDQPSPGTGTFLAPVDGRTMMIIGQDLLSVSQYINAPGIPTPAGITTYVALYEVLNDSGANGVVNGALGFNSNNQPNGIDIDWGGGPLNAFSAAVGFPGSTLQIGLNIAEGNNGNIWCGGCLNQLANGGRDAEINHLANFFLAIPDTAVYLRIGYEFDGLWNNGYENRGTYIAAYRRIVDVLRARGVDNVAYVWQSSASPIDDKIEGFFENIGDWYPGDNYVDWVGLSWFLLPEEQPPVGGSAATQRQLADDVLAFARARGKAVMIAESTAQGHDLSNLTNRHISSVWDGPAGGGQQNLSADALWNQWFVPFFAYIYSNQDVIKAVSYINADWDAQGSWGPPYPEGYWGDTRVQANTTIRQRWINELTSNAVWLNGGNSINQDIGLD